MLKSPQGYWDESEVCGLTGASSLRLNNLCSVLIMFILIFFYLPARVQETCVVYKVVVGRTRLP